VALLFKHALKALYPRTAHFPGIEDTGLDPFCERFFREASAIMRLGVHVAVVLFVLMPIATVYVPLPSFLLPRRLLDRHADRFATFPLYHVRSLALVLKVAAGLCWGADPAVRARLGLPPLPPDPGTWRTS